MNYEDTIAAISTPLGEGAIGIVRLSGPEAVLIVAGCFKSSSGRDIQARERQVYHGAFAENGMVIDEVLVHIMRAPHSYTREDVVEINCHGGIVPLRATLEAVLRCGARLAEPGEFTRRAFLNGRIDLVQAESVIDRIRAQTRSGLQAAAVAANGALSRAIQELTAELKEIRANVEAAIDFPDQDVPDLLTPQLLDRVEQVECRIEELLATADSGRLVREGVDVAITGRPNVGKSSLFNALLRDARALVSERAGTTRDLLNETVNLGGIPVRLTDMAGLHETEDEIERLGVDAARGSLHATSAILFVLDASEGVTEQDCHIAREIAGLDVPVITVVNKVDLAEPPGTEVLQLNGSTRIPVSARTGAGLDLLEKALEKLIRGDSACLFEPGRALINRAHQKNALERAKSAVKRVRDEFGASPELLSIELADALHALGEITGETTPDDLLELIFADFCIGK